MSIKYIGVKDIGRFVRRSGDMYKGERWELLRIRRTHVIIAEKKEVMIKMISSLIEYWEFCD